MAILPRKFLKRGAVSRWVRRNRRVVMFLVAAVTIGVIEFGPKITYVRPVAKLEQELIDLRFFLRRYFYYPPPSPDCVIVGINQSSLIPSNFEPADVTKSEALQLMQGDFPWNRKVYALLLDKLIADGARTVVFDLLFLSDTPGTDDFAAALRKYGDRVVIGSLFTLENPTDADSRQIYRQPLPKLLSATNANITGCATLPAEMDGVIRSAWYRTSELQEYGYADSDANLNITSMAGLAASKFNPGLILPTGSHHIDFQGPPTTYPYLPIEEVFMDEVFNKDPRFEFGKIFENKVVFVGPIAESFHDTHDTPFGLMPGVEIHTQIAASLLQGTTLRDVPDWMTLALSIPMALLAVWASMRMTHALALSGALAGGLLLFIGAAEWAFIQGRMLIPMEAPMFAFAGTGLAGLIINFLVEQLEKARIRGVLDRYVSSKVAELVLRESDQFEKALLGERRMVTCLFSDIRGFTTMTEAAVPENLIEQLNEYFYKMVEAVLLAEGTLQQFVGDAIMAVWGNTHAVDPAVGARHAVRTSLAMHVALKGLNEMWDGNPLRREFKIGVGINHGEVIVGSLGHPNRMEYATIGDGINTAARLETSTKQFGCMILVGELVHDLTKDWFHYREIGRVVFKGKVKAIGVYTPLGEMSDPCPPWLDPYHEAIALFCKRQFHEASAAFEAVRKQIGVEDHLCDMYIARCEECLAEPPPEGWDGSLTLTEK